MAKIRFEGQEVSVADEIAQDDVRLRAALVTAWPSISTADISRTREDGTLIVTCSRKAGTKGANLQIVRRLQAAKESVNPALLMAADLRLREMRGQLTPAMLIRRAPEIQRACKRGEEQRALTHRVADRLRQLDGEPALHTPVGF